MKSKTEKATKKLSSRGCFGKVPTVLGTVIAAVLFLIALKVLHKRKVRHIR